MKPDYQSIIETVTAIFTSCDERNWQELKNTFAEKVLLDYSSLAGNPAATLNADSIIDSWRAVFPGFQSTHHQIGNFRLTQTDNSADVSCYGTATHYLPNDAGSHIWTVVGTYDFHCSKTDGHWNVDKMKFNFKYQDGNTDIPRLATEKAKQ